MIRVQGGASEVWAPRGVGQTGAGAAKFSWRLNGGCHCRGNECCGFQLGQDRIKRCLILQTKKFISSFSEHLGSPYHVWELGRVIQNENTKLKATESNSCIAHVAIQSGSDPNQILYRCLINTCLWVV